MIADPFFLHRIVTANAEIAAAIENLDIGDPDYDEKHAALVTVANQIEALIVRETTR